MPQDPSQLGMQCQRMLQRRSRCQAREKRLARVLEQAHHLHLHQQPELQAACEALSKSAAGGVLASALRCVGCMFEACMV